jgi:hypothetical protein
LALFVPSRRAAAALAFALAVVVAGAVRAQGDPYRLHMDNGVKLYSDRNYPAAVVEFEAAYEARPSANPLMNIALCDKEMFHYARAITALEAALLKHGDSMDAGDKKAAEDAIKEMRALLGTATVTVRPPTATLLVDGDELPAGAADHPLALGPGVHKITARAEGYATAEQTVTVASGREQTVTMTLIPERGLVTIEAPDPRTSIAVDARPVGNGAWSGLLTPGQHIVQMYGATGQPYSMQIVVVAGVPLDVRKDVGGVPLPPLKKDDPHVSGVYLFGLASMLFGVTHPPAFGPVDTPDYGAGYGLRAGFQVNKRAGFELSYEHSSIFTYAQSDATSVSYYRVIADRLTVGLRLITPGKLVRFVGTLGGGFVHNQVMFCMPQCKEGASSFLTQPGDNHVGFDALAIVEAGLEVDIDHVLVDFVAEGEIQSTGNLAAGMNNDQAIFGSLPLINAGPAVRIGYRFW